MVWSCAVTSRRDLGRLWESGGEAVRFCDGYMDGLALLFLNPRDYPHGIFDF